MLTDKGDYSNAAGIGRINAALVLRALLTSGALARTEVAELTGLTRATVTRATAKLIEAGIVFEGEPIRAMGRPMVPIEIHDEDHAVLAIHFGANVSRIGLVSVRGRILTERQVAHTTLEPAALIANVCAEALEVVRSHPHHLEVLGVGASIGGWVDTEKGIVVRYPPLSWVDVPMADMLERNLQLPVFFDQMVRGMALSEMMFGAARGIRDFLQIYIGDVLGAAFVEGGTIRRGPHGAAGEIGHIPVSGSAGRACSCGRTSCLQALVTDPAVREEANTRGILPEGGSIADLVGMSTNAAATELLEERAGYLGEAAAILVDFVSPSLLLIAGPQTRWSGFRDAFAAALFERSHQDPSFGPAVTVSGFGDSTPTTASAALCLDAYYRDPLGYSRLRSRAISGQVGAGAASR